MTEQPDGTKPHNGNPPVDLPDPEVRIRAQRRRFSAEYKIRILEEADRCTEPGEVGSLLRREGLYSSSLSNWRRQRAAGTLGTAKRGRKADPLAAENKQLRRENERLKRDLEKAKLIMDAQKKIAEILEYDMPLRPENNDEL